MTVSQHATVVSAGLLLIMISPPLLAQPAAEMPAGITDLLGQQLQSDWKDRPEWAEMAIDILSDPSAGMGQGNGWFRGSDVRYNWAWIQKRLDGDSDQRITLEEATGLLERRQFDVLDRDRSNALEAEDFDWSQGSAVLRNGDPAYEAFFRLDHNSNGRVSKDELLKFFDERTHDVDFLTAEDLRDGLGLRVAPNETHDADETQGPPESVRMRLLGQLLKKEMGSFQPGPSLDDTAPDFELPLMALDSDELEFRLSGELIKLSDHKGDRPVVLVFGSFT